jgi:hypothetical protein
VIFAVHTGKNYFDGIQLHVVKEIKTIPHHQFQKYSEQWKHRLSKWIDAQGDYIKDDSSS